MAKKNGHFNSKINKFIKTPSDKSTKNLYFETKSQNEHVKSIKILTKSIIKKI